MSPKKYDIVALAAACVDINLIATDEHIEKHGLEKGLGREVSRDKLAAIIENAQDITKTPGSPGANVAMGIALRGGSSALIGKVANDDHGALFTSRLQSHGVDYTPVVSADAATTGVLVLTTPDKERTFGFLVGAGYDLSPEDVDTTLISQAKITYLDSYLWLSETGRETVRHAAEEAKRSGGKLAIALNDAGIVAQNREAFLALVTSHADILLGDRKEFMTLLGTTTIEETIAAVTKLGATASITAGASGAHVVENGKSAHIPTKKVEKIVDTCGAGDAFASGFLYGLSQGKSAEDSGHIGAQWAADIIQHRGAEPKVGKNALPPASPSGPSL